MAYVEMLNYTWWMGKPDLIVSYFGVLLTVDVIWMSQFIHKQLIESSRTEY